MSPAIRPPLSGRMFELTSSFLDLFRSRMVDPPDAVLWSGSVTIDVALWFDRVMRVTTIVPIPASVYKLHDSDSLALCREMYGIQNECHSSAYRYEPDKAVCPPSLGRHVRRLGEGLVAAFRAVRVEVGAVPPLQARPGRGRQGRRRKFQMRKQLRHAARVDVYADMIEYILRLMASERDAVERRLREEEWAVRPPSEESVSGDGDTEFVVGV